VDARETGGRGYPEEDVAAFFAAWCADHRPWAVLAPSTMWGREVAGRMAARLGAGLIGDAVGLVAGHGRLTCWKPAFGGALAAGVTCLSHTQMATVRAGVLPLLAPRATVAALATAVAQPPRNRVRVSQRTRDDDLDLLATASAVVVVGAGVPPEEYPLVTPLLHVLGAQLAATRKVTDQGWQPRARQIGITGRSVAPRLLVSIGTSGKFNHMVGSRSAKSILGINNDPAAPVFAAVDVGIVADWRAAVPRLVAALHRSVPHATAPPARPALDAGGTGARRPALSLD
jgi:electron transfer flavoprotein alpha subunit